MKRWGQLQQTSLKTLFWHTASMYYWWFMKTIYFDNSQAISHIKFWTELSKWRKKWAHFIESPWKRSILIYTNQYLIYNFEMSSENCSPKGKVRLIFSTSNPILSLVHENDQFSFIRKYNLPIDLQEKRILLYIERVLGVRIVIVANWRHRWQEKADFGHAHSPACVDFPLITRRLNGKV